MKHKESYKHKFAKQLLVEWLQKEKTIKGYLQKTCYPIVLKNHKVYEEFPFDEGCSCKKFQKIPEIEKPYCVFDILVCENGIPKYGFEIVHKHKSSDWKIEKLKQEKENFNPQLEVYEVSAEWLLRLIKPPKNLKFIKKLC